MTKSFTCYVRQVMMGFQSRNIYWISSTLLEMLTKYCASLVFLTHSPRNYTMHLNEHFSITKWKCDFRYYGGGKQLLVNGSVQCHKHRFSWNVVNVITDVMYWTVMVSGAVVVVNTQVMLSSISLPLSLLAISQRGSDVTF